MYYECKRFIIGEMVPKVMYQTQPAHILWQLFDDRLLITLDRIWELHGGKGDPIYINNHLWSGPLQYSGWRPWDCSEGAKFSGHKYGRCADVHTDLDRITPEELLEDIIKNPNRSAYEYITEVETGTQGWCHISVRNWRKDIYGLRLIPIK